jgi:hypothetical protein
MTPRVGVKTTLTNGNASLGALVPKQGPHFFAHPFRKQVGQPFLAVLLNPANPQEPAALIDLLRYRNIQVPQHMLYFRFPQA